MTENNNVLIPENDIMEEVLEPEASTLTEVAISEAKKELDAREKDLIDRETKLNSLIEVLTTKEGQLKAEVEAYQQKERDYEKRNAELERRLVELSKKQEKEDKLEADLLAREVSIKEREVGLEKREHNEELELKKKGLDIKAALEAELAQERVNAIESLNAQLAKQRSEFEAGIAKYEKERKQEAESLAAKIRSEAEDSARKIKSDVEAEIAAKKKATYERTEEDIKERTKEIIEREEKLAVLVAENDMRENELNAMEEELAKRESDLTIAMRQNEREKRRLKSKQEELDSQESDLSSAVKNIMTEQIANFNTQLEAKEQALRELRDKVKALMAEQDEIEKFKVSIGKDPAVIENVILNLHRTIEELKIELSKRAPGEIQKERDELRKECEDQKATIAELEKKNRLFEKKNEELASFEISNIGLENKNQELTSLVDELKSQNDTYRQRIERLCSTEARLSDRDQRIAEINKGIPLKLIGSNMPLEVSEVSWLDNIYKQCDRFGIHFPQRILYAFHTALKIADWSSVTILAGVSGTGKSELPKMYAEFGGFNFINVPVQPSWDSQESMLGFYNSIDNRFEPEPLLRYLVQCTENENYNKYMSIVLLDEMNLAHVEHYFADFLSKLETRRGASKSTVPTVEVKLGAGVEPYQLKLERSVLWTGTMNQDETTKSLSDKVLDRGLVINFPRPRILKSRRTMGILEKAVEATNRPMLTRSKWGSWIVREVALEGEQEKELNMYKAIVEEINNELEHVGRALGHRVWQSIEYYIINYPTVVEEMHKLAPGEMSTALREGMKIAFEDQIVQKIMPKLRGVETRGKGKENLGRIETLLEDKGFERLKDDFEIACEQGYGQFIWSSAKYIEADEAFKKEVEAKSEAADSELTEN